MCVFIGEFDGMVPWVTYIGNAYLAAMTSEKVYIRASPVFGELEGTCLSSTKHYMVLGSVESFVDSYYKNVRESLDSDRH